MKTRNSFVSNSSSTLFMIKNTSNEIKTLLNFVEETLWLADNHFNTYSSIYSDSKSLKNEMLICALDRQLDKEKFNPNEEKSIRFGDEDGDVLGEIFDYQLRQPNKSKSFSWCELQSLR